MPFRSLKDIKRLPAGTSLKDATLSTGTLNLPSLTIATSLSRSSVFDLMRKTLGFKVQGPKRS